MFVEHGKPMMAEPVKTLELHYSMIQFLIIIVISFYIIASDMSWRYRNAVQIFAYIFIFISPFSSCTTCSQAFTVDWFGEVSERWGIHEDIETLSKLSSFSFWHSDFRSCETFSQVFTVNRFGEVSEMNTRDQKTNDRSEIPRPRN